MKVVFLIARFHPFKGGAEQNCMQLAKRLVARGHEVTVLTTDATPNNPLPSEEKYQGINILRVHRWNRQLNLGFYPGLWWKLLRIEADVIHVENGPGFVWQEYCLWWKRVFTMFGRKTKFVVTPHGRFLSTPEQHQGLKKKILLGIKVAMWPYFRIFWAPLWDMVIQVNPDQTKWLRGEYGVNPKRIKLVPNGIDRDYIETKLPKKTNTPVIITYLGRISRYKGVGDLISAMKYLQLHHPALLKHVELKLLGKVFDQEVMDLIPSLGLEDVVTLVDTPSDEMRDHILTNESQINVLPSQWEATGIVLIEAMAKGNAIVSSDGNEMANELITPGENGYIFSYGDVPKLAEVLRILIENDKLRQHMIKTNLEQVQKYTWEFIFPVYLNLLKQLIK